MQLKKVVTPWFLVVMMSLPPAGISVFPVGAFAQSDDTATGETSATPQTPPSGGIRDRLREVRENVLERREDTRENIQEKREDARENIQERREGVKTRLEEHRKQLIRGHFERMVRRLNAAILRLEKLGERIQSRINKAKENGKDASAAQSALDLAKTAIQLAKDALESAKSKVETAIGSEDPKTAFEEVRALIETARDKVKEAHQKLVEAIRALRGIGAGSDDNNDSDDDNTATTTP